MRGEGRIFQRGGAWWIAYYIRGDEKRESAGTTEKQAKKLLKKRRGEILGNRYVGPDEEKLTVSDLLNSVAQHLKNKGARGKSHKAAIDRARAHFGLVRALDLKADRIERFIAEEKAAEKPKAAATINRAIQVLKQPDNLAL